MSSSSSNTQLAVEIVGDYFGNELKLFVRALISREVGTLADIVDAYEDANEVTIREYLLVLHRHNILLVKDRLEQSNGTRILLPFPYIPWLIPILFLIRRH